MSDSEEYEYEETRRGKLQLIRDCLLCLELEGRPMKPTLLMYAMRMGWKPMVELVKGMGAKQLIEVTRPGPMNPRGRSKRIDRRSNARISVTLKGKYLLRILDEMLRYLDDERPPYINPPLWLMRKALETKGFTFMGELEDLQKQSLLEAPDWLDDPTPFGSFVEKPEDSVIPTKLKGSPSEREGVTFTLTGVNTLPPIRDYSPYEKDRELAAGFFVVQHYWEVLPAKLEVKAFKVGLHCPECGKEMWGLRAMSIHVGRMHKEKKKEIMAQITKFQAKVA